ncbi:hypothetical protein [Actinoplanes sp. URMC 104]|uniref:hypothetical protein n=1 Tax=Actinoplanes sp. URMC 104 TaxID=3423409 RepID=UPI003F19FBB4
MSEIPWWGLPLVAAVFALAGAAAVQFASARNDYLSSRRKRTRRWYEERKAAYVALLAVFERDTYRLRAAYDAGEKPVPALVYLDDVAPALMRVRLLASGPVRSAALAVHVLLQKLHGEMNPAAVIGVEPQTHFRELLTQVPLVMQEFEAAVRDELRIEATPPAQPVAADADLRGRARALLRRPARTEPLDGLAEVGQDLGRDR